jgi:hypothetical protein
MNVEIKGEPPTYKRSSGQTDDAGVTYIQEHNEDTLASKRKSTRQELGRLS